MIIIKPEWVSHGERTLESRNFKACIYSLHVHPDGTRLATGSLDGNVKIWNIDPILNEKAEQDPNCHKLLCTMTMHNGAVLCVRWSNGEGRYLASSSDNDNVVIIWERERNAPAGTVFGSSDVNYETWRAVKYLRGHESDVQDLAWSKDNQYLASCGVDGYIIVWNGHSFDQVVKIDQHTGFVKGVTWDPAGKFLASQSDDKMVKIWRTSDWGLETDLVDPFINAPGTTLFRRLSWSPDGAHVAAANAVNGIQCIAAIINRDDWNSDVSLVGHQLPVEITAFNPKMFYMKDDNESEKSLATICALGSQDRSISIWVTKFSRPVCVATEIFDNNVYDISWTPDGKTLFACSQDGTIACIQLDSELEDIASDELIYQELTKYGYGRKHTQLPETPIQLELEADNAIVTRASTSKRIAELMTGNTTISTTTSELDTIMTDVPVQNNTNDTKTVISQQKISIAKNGKKRITPMMVTTSTPSTVPKSKPTITPSNQINNDIHYDDPIIPVSGIASTIIGNKRKKVSIDVIEDNVIQTATNLNKQPEWIDSPMIPPIAEASQVRLGVPKVKSILTAKQKNEDPTFIIECHNASNSEDTTYPKNKIIKSKEGSMLWMDYVPSAILVMTGNNIFTAIGCEDGSIYIYSHNGRRLLPPMVLESIPVLLQCKNEWLLCLTTAGLVYTWNMVDMKSQIHSVSIAPVLQVASYLENESKKTLKIRDVHLQNNGLPIIITSLQQAFVYHLDLNIWVRISDPWYILSEFWGSTNTNPLGWLRTTDQNSDPTSKLLLNIAKTDEKTNLIIITSQIETQLAVAALLESPTEYSKWMMYYAKNLSENNLQEKIEELCKWLMGPPYLLSEFRHWEPKIMDTLSKRDLLKQILPVLAQNRQLQRIVAEYKACL